MNKFLLILSIVFQLSLSEAGIIETATLDQCIAEASVASAGVEPDEVLYVFDIDNTLLALNQSFGSVHWFRWQRALIDQGITSNRVAESLPELLEKQGFIYSVSRAHTPEAVTAARVETLQQLGYAVIYHTSRSLDVRDATERELRRNHLLPITSPLERGLPGDFIFKDGLSSQRPVSFQRGIYMSAGQDKGVFLNLLLKKYPYKPKHIVFVDDEEKNLKNVESAFYDKIPTTLCRYSKMDPIVGEFNASDKANEINLWKDFSELIERL